MRRRSLLATLAAGSIGAVAGCSGLSGPVERQSFDICDVDCDWAEQTPDAGADPIVERYADERRVVVYGHMYVGSSSCDKAVLDTAELNGDIFRVAVGVGDRGNAIGGCTADMSPDQYRARFRFRESLPERIVVEEDAAYEPEPSETETES